MSNGKGYHEYPDLLTGSTRIIDYTSDKEILLGDYSCEALHIWHFNPKSKSFLDLPVAPHLKYLEINFSNCTNLIGLEKYPELQRLDLNYCTKLENFNGIENLSKDIYCLWIDHSKKLINHSNIAILSNLKTLGLHSCGTIQNIEFVNQLNELTMFVFMDTNIEDGNMTPLIQHNPKFEFVSFSNKRHFSHKCNEIRKILEIEI